MRGTMNRMKRYTSGRRKGKSIIFAFLAPAILIYSLFFVVPAFRAFRISLFRWKGFKQENAVYVGLDNFKEVVTDRWVRLAMGNNLLIIVLGGIFILSMALFFATALTNRRVRGRSFFKTLIFLPHVINPIGVGLLWVFILQPRFGLLNTVLRSAGLDPLAQAWLGSRQTGIPSITFIMVWYVIGFYMVLLMAGIESIPPELFDAAKVDGATEWQVFWRVKLPLIREVLSIAIVYWVIGALKVFGIVWILTQGGPANSTHTIGTYMISQVLSSWGTVGLRLGYGTAIAVVLFFLVFLVSLLFFQISNDEAVEY